MFSAARFMLSSGYNEGGWICKENHPPERKYILCIAWNSLVHYYLIESEVFGSVLGIGKEQYLVVQAHLPSIVGR